ncbi:hypothetical protein K438DRAFT_1751400 [Mycena galopus ATCC 62051]|nr:hypothetical protein K438DRAFT_1751400 [Mycena galopus ATCC 62051]
MYVCEYDTWRTRLPEEELEKAPILKIFNFSWEEDPDTNTKFFFATRCVPAPDDSITETSPSKAHETDVDRKRRDELIELIKRRNNFLVDKSRLRFEAIKDVHPYYDSLRVRIFSLPPFHFDDADPLWSDAAVSYYTMVAEDVTQPPVLQPPFCGGTKQLGNILTKVRDELHSVYLGAAMWFLTLAVVFLFASCFVTSPVSMQLAVKWKLQDVGVGFGSLSPSRRKNETGSSRTLASSIRRVQTHRGRFDQRRNEAKSSKRNTPSGVITPIGLAARAANDEELGAAGLARGAENVTDAKRKENQKNSDVNRTRGGRGEGVLRLRRLTVQHCGCRQHHLYKTSAFDSFPLNTYIERSAPPEKWTWRLHFKLRCQKRAGACSG